jgi:hypothetical protein
LLIVDELGEVLEELCAGACGAEGGGDLLDLLDGVESLFGVLTAEVVEK